MDIQQQVQNPPLTFPQPPNSQHSHQQSQNNHIKMKQQSLSYHASQFHLSQFQQFQQPIQQQFQNQIHQSQIQQIQFQQPPVKKLKSQSGRSQNKLQSKSQNQKTHHNQTRSQTRQHQLEQNQIKLQTAQKQQYQSAQQNQINLSESENSENGFQPVRYINFKHPECLTKNTYQSIQQIQKLIKAQQDNINRFGANNLNNIQNQNQSQNQNTLRFNSTIKSMWKNHLIGNYYYCNCRKCDSKLSFIIEGDQNSSIVNVRKLQINHKHRSTIDSKQQIEQYFCSNRQRFGQLKFKADVRQRFKVPDRKYYYMMKKFQQHFHNYQALAKFFQKNHYQYKIDRSHNGEKYPNYVLAVSRQMLLSYKTHGDLFYFDTFPTMLITYQDQTVGIFSGQDHKRRPVIFGICSFTKQSKEIYLKIFRQFFRIVKSFPETIVTRQQKIIIQAIDDLKNNNIFKGVHLLNVDQYIQDTISILKHISDQNKTTDWKFAFIQRLKMVIRQRNFENGKKLLVQIVQDAQQQPQIQVLLENFVQKLKLLCFWQSPPVYVGLTRFHFDSNLKISQIINDKISKSSIKFNINKAYQVLQNLNLQLLKTSNAEHIAADGQIQIFFEDLKLKPTRLRFQNKVYTIFFQGYIQARQKIIIKQEIRQGLYVIQNSESSQIFTIDNWKCSCLFYRKTGIPCSHAIALVYYRKQDKQYYELFDKRWIMKCEYLDTGDDFKTVQQRMQTGKQPKIPIKNKYVTE